MNGMLDKDRRIAGIDVYYWTENLKCLQEQIFKAPLLGRIPFGKTECRRNFRKLGC